MLSRCFLSHMKSFKKIIPIETVNHFQKDLIEWYKKNQRPLPWRQTTDPYHIWVSEVMLQQTQVKKVLQYYSDFIGQYPDIHALAAADLQQVLKSWELLGYYARARHLHQAAQVVAEKFQGDVPSDYSQFRQLPGVGDYIAAAVTSLAFNKPYPVVDGNVKRVLSRIFVIRSPVNRSSSSQIFQQAVNHLFAKKNPAQFNQALMELGALLCRPRQPQCDKCPVKIYCRAYATNKQHKYPTKVKRNAVPGYHITVGVIQKDGQLLITQRPPAGLLGGLWEFPGGKIKKGESATEALRREIKEEVNLQIKIDEYLTRVKHAYSHFEIVMEVFLATYLSGTIKLRGAVDYRWISLSDIESYPFPAANHKFFPLLRERLFTNPPNSFLLKEKKSVLQ